MKYTSLFALALLLGASNTVLSQTDTQDQTNRPPANPPSQSASGLINLLGPSVVHSKATEEQMQRLRRLDPLRLQAIEAYKHKQYKQVERLCRKVLAEDETMDECWYLLARVSEKQGRREEALNAYREIIYPHEHWISGWVSEPITHMRFVLLLCRENLTQEAEQVFVQTLGDAALNEEIPEVRKRFAPDVVDIPEKRINTANAEEVMRVRRPFLSQRYDERTMQAVAHYVIGTEHPWIAYADLEEQFQHLREAMRQHSDWPEIKTAYDTALHYRTLRIEREKQAKQAKKASAALKQ